MANRRMRYFIDDREVTEDEATAAEKAGTAKLVRGASGVVPEALRRPLETPEEWLSPWMQLRTVDDD